MSDFLQAALPFLGILVVLVVVHELGHFVTAKLAGVKVLEFGIGFPPRVFGRRFGETEYTLNLLPLGGFVRLLGEEDPSDPRSLAAQPRWVRIAVLSAGSVMNLILPVFLFAAAFMIPREVAVGQVVVEEVAAGSPAAEAGLRPGDVILAVNGREVRNLADLSYFIRLNLGGEPEFTVSRLMGTGPNAEERVFRTRVHARWTPPQGQGPTGIMISDQDVQTQTEAYPPWEAVPRGLRTTWESLILMKNEVTVWLKGGSQPQVAGPVGIAQATGEVVEQSGWRSLIPVAAGLSLNLGIINMLPLPMLDGGRVMFVLIEVARRGKRLAPEKEGLVHLVGFVVLLSLVVIITYFDVLRIISEESIIR
ncbi:MAG TPA: M50 family metallopeptidase [Dehalococcoidia bacterium]